MSSRQESNERFLTILAAAAQQRQLRLGMDFVDNALWYGLEVGGKTHFLRTGAIVLEAGELPREYSVGEGALHGMPLSHEGVKQYLQGRAVNGAALIQQLAEYFGRHAKFEHDEIPTVLAVWVMAGYAHMAFPISPYLAITSAQRGCGKSRVLELIAEVGFRAKPIVINPTPAVLFRSLHDSAQVMLIDEFEDATEDAKRAMITVLNSGFTNGGQVPRCVGDEHNIKRFQTYSPKAFAGLSRLPETLQNRSLPILMMPKTHADKIQPFFPAEYEKQAQRWRDDLAIWALSNAPELAKASRSRQQLGVPDFLEDREADYMATLFATTQVAGIDLDILRSYCHGLAQTRSSRAGEGQATRAAQALAAWYPNDQGEARLFLSDAAKILYDCEAISEPNERETGALLRKMGLQVGQVRIAEQTGKGMILTKQDLDTLLRRFSQSVAAAAAA
jgi:hypothetical protein